MTSPEKRRVLLALTEGSKARPLWQAALDLLASGDAEVVAVFIADERWEHAARLPFTREISSLTGAASRFTQERARGLIASAAERARRKLERMAAKQRRRIAFEIMTGLDPSLIERLTVDAHLTVIAPRELSGSPIHLTFERSRCDIVLVGGPEE